jgi:hypothetical protein
MISVKVAIRSFAVFGGVGQRAGFEGYSAGAIRLPKGNGSIYSKIPVKAHYRAAQHPSIEWCAIISSAIHTGGSCGRIRSASVRPLMPEICEAFAAPGHSHSGGIGTIHAGSALGALHRLERLIQEAVTTVLRADRRDHQRDGRARRPW